MRLLQTFVLALATVLGITTQAHANEAAAVQQLTQLLNQAQTMTARFTQVTLDASGSSLQEASGQMVLKRPGQFRWHTDAPMEQLLVSDGKQAWLYDPDLEQVTVQAMDQRLTHTPALLLSGDTTSIRESFRIDHKSQGSLADFVLTPKGKDTLFDTLRLSFRNGVLNDMQLIDSIGQRTNITFDNVRMNTPVANSEFTFDIPPGVDVIQE